MTDDKQPVGMVNFPTEWFGGGLTWLPGFPEVVVSRIDDATGEHTIMGGGCLSDGTNLAYICWPGGQNIARSGPANHWAMEERVDPAAPDDVRVTWKTLVECSIKAGHEVERTLGIEMR